MSDMPSTPNIEAAPRFEVQPKIPEVPAELRKPLDQAFDEALGTKDKPGYIWDFEHQFKNPTKGENPFDSLVEQFAATGTEHDTGNGKYVVETSGKFVRIGDKAKDDARVISILHNIKDLDPRAQNALELLGPDSRYTVEDPKTGENRTLTFDEWIKEGKPEAVATFIVKDKTSPDNQEVPTDKNAAPETENQTQEEPQTPKTPEELQTETDTLLKGVKEELTDIATTLYEARIDPQQRQNIEAVVKQLFPDVDFKNINKMSPQQLATVRRRINSYYKRSFDELSKDPKVANARTYQQEINRIASEESLLTQVLSSGENPVDIAIMDEAIALEFEADGRLATPEAQQQLLTYNTFLQKQIEKLAPDIEKAEKDRVFKFKVGELEIPITKSGLLSLAKGTAFMSGIVLLFFMMEGNKQGQGQGMPPMH